MPAEIEASLSFRSLQPLVALICLFLLESNPGGHDNDGWRRFKCRGQECLGDVGLLFGWDLLKLTV